MGFNSAFKGLTEGKNRVACGTKLEAVLKKIFVPVVATNLCACCCYKSLCLLLLQMEHQSLSSYGNKTL